MIVTTPLKPLQEFLQRQDIDNSPALELLESGVERKPMATFEHSELQFNLVAAIREKTKDYKAYQELRCNIAEQSLVPDVVVVPASAKPRGHNQHAPVWVIEIRSPDQGTNDLISKVTHCMKHGTQLGWLIDPQRQRLMVWQGEELDIYTGSEVVPGLDILSLTVDEVLALQD